MTHEETITFHARELGSYRELPKILYHFQTKERDEPRPRGGLIRVREFVMKDAYSFDRDDEGLDASFRAHAAAYTRMFERCGLDFVAVEAESGMMGGSESVDYLAPAGSGENTLVTCERGDYAADLEIAHGVPRAPSFPERLDAPAEVETPGITTCEALADFLGHRRRGDVEGDAGRGRREGRPGARERRRPARRRQARRGTRVEYQAGRSRRDQGGVRRGPRLARARRRSTAPSCSTRRSGRGSSSPARTAPATTCAAWSTGGTSTLGTPTSGSRARVTPVRVAAARCGSRRRSRSGTSSSSARSTRRRSTPPTSTSSLSSIRS